MSRDFPRSNTGSKITLVTYEDDISEQKDLEVLTELWHSGVAGQDMELHEFLGMTWEEYQVRAVSPSKFKKGREV